MGTPFPRGGTISGRDLFGGAPQTVPAPVVAPAPTAAPGVISGRDLFGGGAQAQPSVPAPPQPVPAAPAVVSGQDLFGGQDALRSALQGAGEAVGEGLQHVDLQAIRNAQSRLGEFLPEDREVLAARLKMAARDIQAVPKAAAQVAALQAQEGMTGESSALRSKISDTVSGAAKVAAKSPVAAGKWFLHAIDTPARWVRGGQSQEAWEAGLRQSTNPATQAFVEATNALARPAGALIGANLAGAGALTDLAAGRTPSWAVAKKTVEDTIRDTGGFLRGQIADPLTYVSFGAGSIAKNAGRAAVRTVLRVAPGQAATAEALGAEVAKILGTVGGTPQAAPQVRAAFERTLGTDAGKAAFEQAYGRAGQFLERASLAVGPTLPGVDSAKTTVDLGRLVGTEYAGGKAIDAAVEAIRGPLNLKRYATWRPPLRAAFDPTMDQMAAARRVFLGSAATRKEGLAADLRKIAELAPATKARREEIILSQVDPGGPGGLIAQARSAVVNAISQAGPKMGMAQPEVDAAIDALAPEVAFVVSQNPGKVDVAEDLRDAFVRVLGERGNALFAEAFGAAPAGVPAGVVGPHLPGGPQARAILQRMKEIPTSYSPATVLDQRESRWIDAMDAMLGKARGELVQAGVLGKNQAAVNAATGRYYPRVYGAHTEVLDELAELAAARNPNSLASRTADIPLGAAEDLGFLKAMRVDPHEALPRYIAQKSRAEGAKGFELWTADYFGAPLDRVNQAGVMKGHYVKVTNSAGHEVVLPADLYNVVHGTFDQSLHSVASALRKWGIGSSTGGRLALYIADAARWMGSRFKKNVLAKVPGYHTANVVDDVVKMAADGVPVTELENARAALKGHGYVNANGQVWAGDALRDLMHEHNIGHGTFERAELGALGQNLPAQLDEIALRAQPGGATAGQRAWGAAKAAARRADNLLVPFGSWWQDHTQAAVFLHRLKLGDSPAQAAQRAFDILLDYGDRSKHLQIASWFVPFATWAWKAPRATLGATLRRPGGVLAAHRLMEAQTPEDPRGHKLRQDIAERGDYFRGSPRAEEVAGNIRQALGGGPWRPGFGLAFRMPNTFAESMTPVAAALQGNADPLLMMASPAIRAAVEGWSGRDLVTKQDLASPTLAGMFPRGAPVPVELQAAAGANPWFARYVSPYLLGGVGQFAVNRAAFEAAGGEQRSAPLTTLGVGRPYTTRGRAGDAFAMQLWNLGTRMPMYETDPVAELQALAREGSVKRAPAEAKDAKDRMERSRRSSR